MYVDDLRLPAMVHVAFVRSIHAHARIRGIEKAAALAQPGVVAVVTAADLAPLVKSVYPSPEPEMAEPGADSDGDGSIPVPLVEPLASKKVRYVGEPIAAVLAESRAQAVDAAELVEVDYEPLPAVVDPYEAREDGRAAALRQRQEQHQRARETVHGDVDAALAGTPRSGSRRASARRAATRCRWSRGGSSPRPIR